MNTKKSPLISIIAVCAIVLILMSVACSSDNMKTPLTEKKDQDIAFIELNENIKGYCSSFIGMQKTSRGDHGWGKFRDALKADHGGYSNGGAIISISASRKRWKDLQAEQKATLVEERYIITEEYHDFIESKIDSLIAVYKNDELNIGALHNATILQSIITDDMEYTSTAELVSSVISSLASFDISFPDVDINQTALEIDNFFENIYSTDVTVMYNNLSEIKPECQQEFEIISQYLETIDQLDSMETIDSFTDGFRTIVAKSDLSSEKKEIIQENITVAPASLKLWQFVDQIPTAEPEP